MYKSIHLEHSLCTILLYQLLMFGVKCLDCGCWSRRKFTVPAASRLKPARGETASSTARPWSSHPASSCWTGITHDSTRMDVQKTPESAKWSGTRFHWQHTSPLPINIQGRFKAKQSQFGPLKMLKTSKSVGQLSATANFLIFPVTIPNNDAASHAQTFTDDFSGGWLWLIPVSKSCGHPSPC